MLRGQRKTRLLLLLGLLLALSFLRYALHRAVHPTHHREFAVRSKGCRILSRKLDTKAENPTQRIDCGPEKKGNGGKCCYQNIFRIPGDDDGFRIGDECRATEELLVPESGMELRGNDVPEFIRVSCGASVEHLRPLVPFKEQVEDRCNKLPKRPHQVSVLLFAVEGAFPSTTDVLRRFPVVRFDGQAVVGAAPFDNLVPLLTGQAVDELDDVCGWPSPRPERPEFDQCPHLWRTFAELGFRTMFAEIPAKNAIFNFNRGGFSSPPTDYYPRPFFLAAGDGSGCVGGRTEASVLLRYVQTFVRRFAPSRYLAVVLGAPDRSLAEALESLRSRKHLESTVLVVLGTTHGEGTVQLALPLWFESKFPEAVANLRRNARARLTTPFDLHLTLKDLADPARHLDAATLTQRQALLRSLSPRGISLFLDIADSRDCLEAHVPRNWCPCLDPESAE